MSRPGVGSQHWESWGEIQNWPSSQPYMKGRKGPKSQPHQIG